MLETIRKTILSFCQDFIQYPYKCYTEHGQHALFYTMLYNTIPEEQRFLFWNNQKICVLQKEYPTAGKLGKPKRQHWDIAVLKSPLESLHQNTLSFDYLRLLAAIEFGLNESEVHLRDDIDRLCDEGSNIENRFIIHLYRLSASGDKFSGRDWSSKSPRILTHEQVQRIATGKPVNVFYGMSDSTGKLESGVWYYTNDL